MDQPTYMILVDGHLFTTDSKATVGYLYRHAESTMTVSIWDDPSADYVPVQQTEFCNW